MNFRAALPWAVVAIGCSQSADPVIVRHAVANDVSQPLGAFAASGIQEDCDECPRNALAPDGNEQQQGNGAPAFAPRNAAGAAVEQTTRGTRPSLELVASFDGLGVGFDGPQGPSNVR